MPDIEAPSLDPDPADKVQARKMSEQSKPGRFQSLMIRTLSNRGSSKAVTEDERMLKEKADMFKYTRQKDTEEAVKNLENLLLPMRKEEKAELCKKRDNEGNTAFHIAAQAGNVEACKLLQRNGAEMNSKNHNEMSPLQFAARYGDQSQQGQVWKCMEWIMEENKKVEENDWKEKDRSGFNLLHLAIQNMNGGGEVAVVEGLSRMGDFSVTDADEQRNNCLHLAAQLDEMNENKTLCMFLRMKDAPDIKKCLEDKNSQGKTPLECACEAGNVDSVKQLLESADVKPPGQRQTPFVSLLFIAVEHNREQLVEFLMKELKARNPEGWFEGLREKNAQKKTLLHIAAENDQASFARAVLYLNTDIVENLLIEKDENGNTPFHVAARVKTNEVANLFLDYVRRHANHPMKHITENNHSGWTPFSVAVAADNLQLAANILKPFGASNRRYIVNQSDFKNSCPLHLAAKHGYLDLFRLLLENGAELTKRGPKQMTPLDIAIEKEQRTIIQAVIRDDKWKEAFLMPSTSTKGKLDTPFRKLVRSRLPDLTAEVLDRCCVRKDKD